MKNKTPNQPLLFVDTIFTECEVEEQTLYKTPQKKPKTVVKSDFIHAFDTMNCTKEQYLNPMDELEDIETVEVVVDDTMNHSQLSHVSTEECRYMLSYLYDILNDKTKVRRPIVQVKTLRTLTIGQLIELNERTIRLQTFEQLAHHIDLHEIIDLQILKI